MQPASSLRRVATAIAVGATSIVTAGLLAMAIRGSVIAQGNFICDVDANKACSLVSGINAVLTPLGFGVGTGKAPCTTSGGYLGANSCYIASPYASSNTYGLPSSQTGAINWIQFEIISNPKGLKFDGWRASGPQTASGAGALQYFDNLYQTGTVLTLYAGSGVLASSRNTLLGPTQGIAVNTLGGSGGYTIRLTSEMRNTRIGRFDAN